MENLDFAKIPLAWYQKKKKKRTRNMKRDVARDGDLSGFLVFLEEERGKVARL